MAGVIIRKHGNLGHPSVLLDVLRLVLRPLSQTTSVLSAIKFCKAAAGLNFSNYGKGK